MENSNGATRDSMTEFFVFMLKLLKNEMEDYKLVMKFWEFFFTNLGYFKELQNLTVVVCFWKAIGFAQIKCVGIDDINTNLSIVEKGGVIVGRIPFNGCIVNVVATGAMY